jgi:hypothetical protein
MSSDNNDLVYRLRKRAEIRRNIPHRKSVQEGKPDRIADLLDEAANELDKKELFDHAYKVRCLKYYGWTTWYSEDNWLPPGYTGKPDFAGSSTNAAFYQLVTGFLNNGGQPYKKYKN